MTTTRIRRCGEAALLLDCADLAEAVSLAGRIEQWWPEPLDVVAAARTVLVTARDASALPGLRRRLEALLTEDPLPGPRIRYPDSASESGGGVADLADAEDAEDAENAVNAVTIDVRYDGPDLAAVADLAGMSTEALVRAHTSILWRAAFGGFAPGFFYLVDARELDVHGLDAHGLGAHGQGAADSAPPEPALPVVPRLSSPRARVPAGSVGVADRFCAVYPGASPGGWQLLGTTDVRLWDLDRPDPALLTPGATVRFREVDRAR